MSPALLRFVHISDSHLPPGHARQQQSRASSPPPRTFLDTVARIVAAGRNLPAPQGSLRQTLDAINALPYPIDFVLHTGDVGFDFETLDEYRQTHALFATCRVPVHVLAGNHDRADLLHAVFSAGRALTSTFDYELAGYAAQIVCLNTSRDSVSNEQLRWLASRVDGPDTRPLLVAMHHNVVPFEAPFPDYCALENSQAVHDILRRAGSRLRGVFYGHLHVALDTIFQNVPYFCAPSTWQQFDINAATDAGTGADTLSAPGFNVVTLTEQATHVRKITIRSGGSADPAPPAESPPPG